MKYHQETSDTRHEMLGVAGILGHETSDTRHEMGLFFQFYKIQHTFRFAQVIVHRIRIIFLQNAGHLSEKQRDFTNFKKLHFLKNLFFEFSSKRGSF